MYKKAILLLVFLWGSWLGGSAQQRPLSFEDVMRFRSIESPVISEDGEWVAFGAVPDRGDGELLVQHTESGAKLSHPRGFNPRISKDSRWVASLRKPAFQVQEELENCELALEQGMLLLDLSSGRWEERDHIIDFSLSKDSQWIAFRVFDLEREKEACAQQKAGKGEKKDRPRTGRLVLRHLERGTEVSVEGVELFTFDPKSRFLHYSIPSGRDEGASAGVFYRALSEESPKPRPLMELEEGRFSQLSWSEQGEALAFLSSLSAEEPLAESSLQIWRPEEPSLERVVDLPAGWYPPLENELSWSKDGERLFFGLKPEDEKPPLKKGDQRAGSKEGEKGEAPVDPYETEAILEKRQVDIWHWDDPLIIPHQKKRWDEVKKRTYRAVFHRNSDQVVLLASETMPEVPTVENRRRSLGLSDLPYRKEVTWEGRFFDAFAVDLETGRSQPFAARLNERPSLSPGGRYLAFFREGNWHLHDADTGVTRNLTAGIETPFSNEDHDYPQPADSYGDAGWLEDDRGVLIYDKYDIWLFSTREDEATNLTAGRGRSERRVFRLVRTDPDQQSWKLDQEALLTSYHDVKKNYGFYRLRMGRPGVTRLLEEAKKFTFVARAKEAPVFLFTRESYREFPDLWVAGPAFEARSKLSDVNPQISEFAWGDAELVEWKSLDGIPLQGVLIKPGGYEPGRRYPVLVYFYRFFSQRLYEFNQPVVNHRPCFPLYAGHGYALFLPDIRFEVGRPGFSALKSLLPGVQKLVDMGVADPDAIGLHGHSWSGYQTAYLITQTDRFAAAIAGAPVSNMTSAYSGIRLGSGLARQFQYEQSQSRIGGSLWEYPERYIENSPVFFADRVKTPLLLMFGDEDDAVPWSQGVELYLAMRRLGKDAIFLQYRGEPHHLKKYANKLDYAIKMKEYLDHYLKGEEAPPWIREGVAYKGP